MDFLGWELERQRNALAALLLGGGAREGEREADRRSPAEPEAAPEDAAGQAGRYAGGRSGKAGGPEYAGELGGGGPKNREAAGEAGMGHFAQTAAEAASVPEAVPHREEAPERIRRDTEADPPKRSGREARRNAEGSRSGGPDAPAAFSRPSGSGTGAQPAEKGAEAAGTPGPAGERPAGRPSGGREAAEAASAKAESRRAEGTARLPGERGEASALRWSAVRRTGGGTVFPWGGGRETGALRAEDGARELSRAVQRDARRYDGGFTIY